LLLHSNSAQFGLWVAVAASQLLRLLDSLMKIPYAR
jgi:hypothetical protein